MDNYMLITIHELKPWGFFVSKLHIVQGNSHSAVYIDVAVVAQRNIVPVSVNTKKATIKINNLSISQNIIQIC